MSELGLDLWTEKRERRRNIESNNREEGSGDERTCRLMKREDMELRREEEGEARGEREERNLSQHLVFRFGLFDLDRTPPPLS